MAVRVVNLGKTVEHVYEGDPDKEDKEKATVFEIGPLPSWQTALVQDGLTTFDNVDVEAESAQGTVHVHVAALKAVRFGLRNVRNLQDEDGKPIEFKLDKAHAAGRTIMVAAPAVLDAIPLEVQLSLYRKIMELSRMTAQERKN